MIRAYDDKWTVVPEADRVFVPDRALDDAVWKHAAPLSDFRTFYANEPAADSPVYRIAYDGANLYIRGSFGREAEQALAHIEALVRPPSVPDGAFCAVKIPWAEASRLAGTDWNPTSKRRRIDIVPISCRRSGHGEAETYEVEAAVPLAAFGVETIVPGEEWGLNIVHVHHMNTRPMLSWVPVRTSTYVDGGSRPGGPVSLRANIADEERFGSLFMKRLPHGTPWRPVEWEFDYTGFAEKRLSFMPMEPGASEPRYVLHWKSPDEAWREIEPIGRMERGDRVVWTFRHPEPLRNGMYKLRLTERTAGPGQGTFAELAFDRTSMIEAGLALAGSRFPPPSPRMPTAWAPPSAEARRLLELVPDKSGMDGVGVPERPELMPEPFLYRLSDDGRSLISTVTGLTYPNERYPESHKLTVRNGKGETTDYPYYEAADGTPYFFSAALWARQRSRVMEAIPALASADPSGAARLLYRLAQAAEGYVPLTKLWWNMYPFDAFAGPPFNIRSGVWVGWPWLELQRLNPLLKAYDELGRTDAFERLGDETGTDVHSEIVTKLFDPTVEFVLGFPRLYSNLDPYIWRDLIDFGKALGRPDYIHFVVEWAHEMLATQFVSDGFWNEITLSYHLQVVGNIRKAMESLEGYSDRDGYVSPRTGRRFDRLDVGREFPLFERANAVSRKLVYPNGKALPIQDTWASNAVEPDPDAGTLLLPAAGVGRLTLGRGANQWQLYLLFSPKNGHNHKDPLHMTLFAEGQELLPDIGYTYTKYRPFATCTIGHNTVVVNGKDMEIDETSRAGGRIERFVAEVGLLQMMRVVEPAAYAETERYGRELWFVPFAGDLGRGYALDVFRVSGGERHEYTLQGDANRDAVFRTDLPLEPYGPYLLTPGTPVREPVHYGDFGSAGGEYPGYLYVRDVSRVRLQGERFAVTLETRDGDGTESARLNIAGLLDDGPNELYLGRSPSVRTTRLHGGNRQTADNDAEADKYDMPKLVLRREGPGLRSTFVTVLEPYREADGGRGAGGPRIEAIDRLRSERGPAAAVVVRIVYGDVTDILLSNPHPEQPLMVGDIALHGETGFIRMEDGAVTILALSSGTRLRKGVLEVKGAGPVSGTVAGTLRRGDGDEVDALVTDTPVPDQAIGRYAIVTHPDGTASGFRIGGIRRERGSAVLELADQDPGFRIGRDGASEQIFHPGKRWSGTHAFEIANVEIRLFGPGGRDEGPNGKA